MSTPKQTQPATDRTVKEPTLGLADLPLRPELQGAEPYGAPQLDVAIRLNVNENPYPAPAAMSAELGEAAAAEAAHLNRYPDREARALRADLANYLNRTNPGIVPLNADNIWVANGSNEVMTHLLQAFGGPGRSLLLFPPTYSMYPEYARNTHTGVVTAPRAADFSIDLEAARQAIAAEQPAVVMIASPNNPTGTATDPEVLAALVEAAPGMVIVDEAYAEFARQGTPSALELLADHPRLVVTRTMSKAFGFAGGRLGYLAASPAVVDACRIVRLPYHLSALSQLAARVALRHTDALLEKVDALRSERDRLTDWLRGRGYEVAESDANFVYFGTFDDRHAVFSGLLERGVLIRETGPDRWLRVSAGTAEEMAGFRQAMDSVARDLGLPQAVAADQTNAQEASR
ncbi:histidinol-phosphate transaminase [Naumannella halotolerans]|uniref:Histidinol-phosphate aminotransferase n=1 Tax=Naumannella halotolerans TaxID=993414 RepID=A0A4V3ENE7_9ACTN|nr:histidinol-phosphate transaminase [Naumannella halotolerans]TDT33518.1 histidinol-phosphate aminotransferase [Naumannella halotolerans]